MDMKALLIVIVILVFIPIIAYIEYVPEDHCRNVVILEEMQAETEKKLGMSYLQYSVLTKNEQIRLWKEDKDYLILDSYFDMILDEKAACAVTRGKSKYERFEDAVYSWQLFK